MIETIFALLMFLNGKLENYSPKATVADCLEQKRKVERDGNPNSTQWQCKEIKAILLLLVIGIYLITPLIYCSTSSPHREHL